MEKLRATLLQYSRWHELGNCVDRMEAHLESDFSDRQRKIKVGNLIAELRRRQKIVNQGSDTRPSWALVTAGRE